MSNDDDVSADEAARLLGVSVATLYAYVSRKRLRSLAQPGSRARRYARADIERLLSRDAPAQPQITILTEAGPLYRGHSAVALAEHSSLEAVAALLWEVDEAAAFTDRAPRRPPHFAALDAAVTGEAGVDRAVAHFPFLEPANPQAFDLSPAGMARTGADIVRWLAAIILHQPEASAEPVHIQFGRVLGLRHELTDLVRRLLVLSADHGFEESSFAVRAVAGTGVTPWRAVASGLAVATGRASKFEHSNAVRRFIAEILEGSDPEAAVIRRVREQEELPGFASAVYPHGDPRAAALLGYCERAVGDDDSVRRLLRALKLVHELKGLRPSLPLLSSFIAAKIGLGVSAARSGLSSTETPYLVGRAAGWVAHAIDAVQTGEAPQRDARYKGRMPA